VPAFIFNMFLTDMSSLWDFLIANVLFSSATDMSSLWDFLSAIPYRKLKHTVNKVLSLRDLLSADVIALFSFGRGSTSFALSLQAVPAFISVVALKKSTDDTVIACPPTSFGTGSAKQP
jgi:hypothetical protein